MPHSRFFLNIPFQKQEEVFLSGSEAHHLQHVMRKKEEEIVEIVNGFNQLAQAKVLLFEKKGVRLAILEIEEKLPSPTSLILCLAIPKLNRLDTIIEKGTELGMGELWLFPGQLSEKKELNSSQLKRLETISIAAMKQCGRLDLPKIILKPPLLKWERSEDTLYFGDTDETAPYLWDLSVQKKRILFLVGPEAGFSHEERTHLFNCGAKGVRLHPNILRTDTAAIAALSLLTMSYAR